MFGTIETTNYAMKLIPEITGTELHTPKTEENFDRAPPQFSSHFRLNRARDIFS
jgi:hypothetical protein